MVKKNKKQVETQSLEAEEVTRFALGGGGALAGVLLIAITLAITITITMCVCRKKQRFSDRPSTLTVKD